MYGSLSSSLSEHGGISVDIDGSHDGEIHCLKAGGVAADAHETIVAGLPNFCPKFQRVVMKIPSRYHTR